MVFTSGKKPGQEMPECGWTNYDLTACEGKRPSGEVSEKPRIKIFVLG